MSLLPGYRAQLYDAAQRRRRRRTRLARWWPVAVSTAVVAGVVVIAVALLSHREVPSSPAHEGPGAVERQLLDTLGVLRRPQTSADLKTFLPGFLRHPAALDCPQGGRSPLRCTISVDRPLIRTIDVRGSRYKVGIIPVTRRAPAAAGRTLVGVTVTLTGPGVYEASAGPRGGLPGAWSLGAIRKQGLVLSAYVSDGINRGVILVPDGVARVLIGPVHLLDTKITTRFAPIPGATATAHDNVALFELDGLSMQKLALNPGRLGKYFSEGSGRGCRVTSAVYALPATATMVWLDAGGQPVNHARINFPVYVGTHHPAPGTTVGNPDCSSQRSR